MSSKKGKVYLVGAGPGDPGLLTLKGLCVLKEAEVVFYDNLVNPKILEFASPQATLVNVGKRGQGTSTDQSHIEDELVRAAKENKIVVRLKGGDPFIFGRGGEEAERLSDEKIEFEVVPGISSAIAVPAYAGIPLTHRDFTHTVAFVTGHANAEIDWQSLAKMKTLVFLMGVKTLGENLNSLMQAGLSPQTPAAFIRWGSYPKQQTIVSTLAGLPFEIKSKRLMPPAIVVVGEVVKLREKINWFEHLPLFGKKIIITRPRENSSLIAERLSNLGACVLEVPVIETFPLEDVLELDEAIHQIKDYEWIIFTSVPAVKFFIQRVLKLKKDLRVLYRSRFAVVGSETAKALSHFYLSAEKVPNTFTAEDLAKLFSVDEVKGKKILFPKASLGGEVLIQSLQSLGASVNPLVIYETRKPEQLETKLQELKAFEPDCVLFASSSAVKNFSEILDVDLQQKYLQTPVLCMGPVTEKSAKELGYRNLLTLPEVATSDGMIERLVVLFATQNFDQNLAVKKPH